MDEQERAELHRTYASIAQAGLDAFNSGKITADAVPGIGDARWGMSLVLRFPGLASATHDVIEALGEDRSNGLTFYEPGDVHVTLRSVEGRWAKPHTCEFADALGPVIAEHRAKHGPVAIRFRGLVMAPSGVMAKGFPETSLQPLRRSLSSALGDLGNRFNSPERPGTIRSTAHVTLGIFERPPAPASDVAATVSNYHDHDFGLSEAEQAELVVYVRRPGAIEVVTVAEAPLLS